MKNVFLLLFVFIVGCGKPPNKLYVLANDVHGLKENDAVEIHGYNVGSVLKINLSKDNKPVVEVVLNEEGKIPVGSTFSIVSKDLLGGKLIRIYPAKNSNYIQSGDTVICVEQPTIKQTLDTLIRVMLDKLDTLKIEENK